jgi:hypothetical protein
MARHMGEQDRTNTPVIFGTLASEQKRISEALLLIQYAADQLRRISQNLCEAKDAKSGFS